MSKPIYLSVIVPVHNEERRLDRCVDELTRELKDYPAEIVFVNNGSHDRTGPMIEQYSRTVPRVRAIQLFDRGKGLAVRAGMLAASGYYRYMCDVDLSTPASEIHRFLEFGHRADIVIGSREIDHSQTTTSLPRRVIGRAFHALVEGVLPRIHDTQCGFKLFRNNAARFLFENSTVNGMAFDVEVLSLAMMAGFSIEEIAVPWVIDRDSRVRLGVDSLDMLLDVLELRMRRARVAVSA